MEVHTMKPATQFFQCRPIIFYVCSGQNVSDLGPRDDLCYHLKIIFLLYTVYAPRLLLSIRSFITEITERNDTVQSRCLHAGAPPVPNKPEWLILKIHFTLVKGIHVHETNLNRFQFDGTSSLLMTSISFPLSESYAFSVIYPLPSISSLRMHKEPSQ